MMLHREGIWLVKKEIGTNGLENVRADFLEGISEKDKIDFYPFINVEKFRPEIERAISKVFLRNATTKSAVSLKDLANNIILELSNKIQFDREKQILSKSDFYE